MAEKSKTSVDVATTATTLLAVGNYDFAILCNNSDTTIYIDLIGPATSISTSNGIQLASGKSLHIPTGLLRDMDAPIQALHASTGTKAVAVQYRKL